MPGTLDRVLDSLHAEIAALRQENAALKLI